ncbi:juvenile hormone epoxide hydrolase 2-like [Episyrphus balteatus]|uniref:juvenile hormone epoxide hydrolase 2-like n=1 Tax=Episyrphus balteatus TaxID=286459 RepID=UPI002486934E|nr:juvenile hormone epoxide hydrolase 2-like [Episyrphus balteatus]
MMYTRFIWINVRILGAISALGLSLLLYQWILQPLALPQFNTTRYWGPGDGKDYVENTDIRPLKIMYDQDTIKMLRKHLDRHIDFQNPLEEVGFHYGFNTRHIRPLIDYWKGVYLQKWKVRQEYLNQFKHYMTQVNGLHIHFIWEYPKEPAPAVDYIRLPILLLHGWPGSIREFYDLIPKLLKYTDEDAFGFEIVAPSLVGFGFSSSASKKGFSTTQMAIVMRNLMLRLGYKKFIVHGGDWGAVIGSHMATIFPENVIGYHTNLCVMQSPQAILKTMIASLCPPLFVKKEYEPFHFPILEKYQWLLEEGGYFLHQATKPDTIGVALAANPVGLAAYILEKFSTGTNTSYRDLDDGGLFDMTIDLDAMLDNIMIYYLGNKIMSSMRFYAESMTNKPSNFYMDRVPTYVPMGCIRFRNDIPTPIDWALKDKYRNIIHLDYSNRGGHFAAMEVPDILHQDIVTFVRKLCFLSDCTQWKA